MANMSFEDYLKGRSKYERQKSREKLLEDYKKFKERQKVLEQKQMANSGKMINMPNLTRDGFEMKQKFRKEKLRRLKNKAGAAAGMVTGAAVSVGMRNKDKIKNKISDIGNMKVKDAAKAIGRGIVALTPVGLGREAGKLITSKKQDSGQTRRPPKEDVQRVRERLKKEKGRSLRRIGVSTMLIGGQAKLDKNKNNKIDAQDFKILRAEKAKNRGMGLQDEKMKPGKVMKAKEGKSILGGANKPTKIKLTGFGSVLRGTGGPAGRNAEMYKKYLKGLKKATAKKSMKTLGRSITEGGLKAAKATRIGKIAAGVAGAALLAKAGLEKMYEKRTGKKPFTKRPDKKMGGGMMMRRPMMANKGKMTNKDKQERKTVKNLAKRGGTRGMVSDVIKGMGAYMSGGLTEATQKLKAQGKMGGGMMQRPMMAMGGGMMPGYKKGKSVMAKGCKLGRKKPTKMYT